jgi:hypothetical protein
VKKLQFGTPLKVPRKAEFYQDFLALYWQDEANCGLSDFSSYEDYDINEFMHIEGDDTEMVSRRILIEKYKDIKRFVDIASKYGDDLIIKGINYEFPACSLMSVMSLVDLSDSVRIMFPEEYIESVETDFAEWLCEV